MRRTWVIALLAAVVALSTGCGSAGTSERTGPTVPATTDPPGRGNLDDVSDDPSESAPPLPSSDPVPGTTGPDPTDPTDSPIPVPASTRPGADPPEAGVDPALAPAAERLRTELAAQLGVDPATIAVLVAEFVVWSDGSLGCPEPGKFYTQALVDGVRIVLDAAGQTYSYHGGGDTDLFLCTTPTVPPPAPAPGGDT